VAISQNTADTLYANYGFPKERTHVIPLYVPPHFFDEAESRMFFSPEPYVLFVGSLESRKNLAGAVESFRLSGLGERGYRFVIAGGTGHGSEEISRAVRATRNVFVTGYVENAELHALYRGASAFVYPSYLEGFGIPLLEALHFGVPAVASTTGACPEVGGNLIRYFDPDDHLSFAREMVRLIDLSLEERQAYATAAQQWVRDRFSMARFDAGLLTTLRHANV
jgi:glycosyltransferase involved in cell wall biosynthesis